METQFARVGPAPASRPSAERVLEPITLAVDPQPTLPWAVPDSVAPQEQVEPALRQVAAAITAAVVEVLSGQRPVSQLERLAHPDLVSLVGHLCRARVGANLRLRSIRVQVPQPNVIEVAAHLRLAAGSRAAALRLQRRQGQWVCTHLEIALRPDVVNRAG